MDDCPICGKEHWDTNCDGSPKQSDELTRLRSDLEKAIEALKHAQRNMPHPDQMIDDTLSELENSK